MGRKRNRYPKLENVEIVDAGAEGKAVGKVDERVVFVPWAVPGDVVDVQVVKKKKSYYEGRITAFKKYSGLRIEPQCRHFGVCGGCKWQHLNYKDQLRFKQKQVEDALTRIAKIDISPMKTVLANDKPLFYRNKLEFTFSNFRWLEDYSKDDDLSGRNMNGLGFHIPGMFDRIVDVKECLLQPEPSNAIRLAVRDFALNNQMSFFDLKKQEGLLRNLIIRTSTTGDIMVIVVFYEDKKEERELLMNFIKDSFPQVTSLMYIINQKRNDSITDQEVITFAGNDHIIEQMEDPSGNMLKFKIGPKSFYQTNSVQARNLYSVAASFAGLTGNEVVYDLYTGTGTIACFVASKASKVVGIEYVEEAIEDAKVNAGINGISNASFFAGDMVKVLTGDFVKANGRPDVVITDPPRAGMHTKVVEMLLMLETPVIVYVSCNPATQARDIALLKEKYDVVDIQPVDMFPQTAHVENVAKLVLRG